MTQPLTPREKVRQIIDDALNSAIPEPWEVANHATDRILTALASGSGDHAELAGKLRSRTDSIVETPLGPFRSSKGRLRNPDGPKAADAIEALLAENAALRAERVTLVEQKEGAEDALFNALTRATEAERKLAEAVTRLERWEPKPFCQPSVSSGTSKEAERG